MATVPKLNLNYFHQRRIIFLSFFAANFNCKSFQRTIFVSGNGRAAEERHLEPWDGCDGDVSDSPSLNGDARLEDLELEHRGANGWDANDMFRKNEEIYGVHSTYDHSLTGYTVQLQRKDTQDYR